MPSGMVARMLDSGSEIVLREGLGRQLVVVKSLCNSNPVLCGGVELAPLRSAEILPFVKAKLRKPKVSVPIVVATPSDRRWIRMRLVRARVFASPPIRSTMDCSCAALVSTIVCITFSLRSFHRLRSRIHLSTLPPSRPACGFVVRRLGLSRVFIMRCTPSTRMVSPMASRPS